jgi:hypothetical protein
VHEAGVQGLETEEGEVCRGGLHEEVAQPPPCLRVALTALRGVIDLNEPSLPWVDEAQQRVYAIEWFHALHGHRPREPVRERDAVLAVGSGEILLVAFPVDEGFTKWNTHAVEQVHSAECPSMLRIIPVLRKPKLDEFVEGRRVDAAPHGEGVAR